MGYAIFAILMGHILRYLGRKNATIFGLALLSVDFLLAVLVGRINNKLVFVILYWGIRFLHGAAQAFIQVTTYSIIATCFKENIANVVGLVEFSWGCGIAIGPLIAEFMYNMGGFDLPLYVFSGFMLALAIINFLAMTRAVEGCDSSESHNIQATETNVSNHETSIEEELKEKIPIWKLFKYKLFVFGVSAAFFNLILYTLLEPILAGRLTKLGVKEESLGQYFWIQPFVYAVVSSSVGSLILKRIHKRICLIIGFFIFAVGFVVTGPSGILFFLTPSVPLICAGLALLGIGCSLSFVPIFPEMISSKLISLCINFWTSDRIQL